MLSPVLDEILSSVSLLTTHDVEFVTVGEAAPPGGIGAGLEARV